jgi:hypothetical protein
MLDDLRHVTAMRSAAAPAEIIERLSPRRIIGDGVIQR